MTAPDNRSLSSGVSLPRWMKTKITDNFDLDQNTFSPTELDDSFMYFYGSKRREQEKNNGNETGLTISEVNTKLSDVSKHTAPCQKFLKDGTPNITNVSVTGKVKPNGIDDGFKGDAAKCGSSIIHVAHKMVASNSSVNLEESDTCSSDLKCFNNQKRRSSKSLPASPLTTPNSSPRSRRRLNKFFTGAYVENNALKGSWILSNLLGQREFSQSASSNIGEDLDRSTSNLFVEEAAKVTEKPQTLKAKPSELREMNFWSPTSM